MKTRAARARYGKERLSTRGDVPDPGNARCGMPGAQQARHACMPSTRAVQPARRQAGTLTRTNQPWPFSLTCSARSSSPPPPSRAGAPRPFMLCMVCSMRSRSTSSTASVATWRRSKSASTSWHSLSSLRPDQDIYAYATAQYARVRALANAMPMLPNPGIAAACAALPSRQASIHDLASPHGGSSSPAQI